MSRLLPELQQFVRSLETQNFDVVIPIERKGMALMRFLLSQDASKLNLDPAKLLSSEALEFKPPKWFSNKRICIFDDTLFTGRNMAKQVADIQRFGAETVSTAFAVCEWSTFKPTHLYYDHLSFQDYTVLRSDMIRMISQSQILLLDTEHIGLRIHTTLSSSEIMKKLQKLGGVLITARLGNENNENEFVSIHKPGFFEEFLQVTPGLKDASVFRKLRFLIGRDGSLWIVPIVYASTQIPASYKQCPTYAETKERDICLCCTHTDNSIRTFYCRNLYWSAKLLGLTLQRLKTIMEFDEPRFEDESDFPVNNLSALFPMLDIGKWKTWFISTVRSFLDSEHPIGGIVDREYPVIPIGESMEKIGRRLVNALLEHQERVISGMTENKYEQWISKEELALTYDDVFKLFSDTDDYLVSQTLDILIDRSIIIPTTKKVELNGKTCWVRGARLDGEYTYQLARMVRKSLTMN